MHKVTERKTKYLPIRKLIFCTFSVIKQKYWYYKFSNQYFCKVQRTICFRQSIACPVRLSLIFRPPFESVLSMQLKVELYDNLFQKIVKIINDDCLNLRERRRLQAVSWAAEHKGKQKLDCRTIVKARGGRTHFQIDEEISSTALSSLKKILPISYARLTANYATAFLINLINSWLGVCRATDSYYEAGGCSVAERTTEKAIVKWDTMLNGYW